MAARGRSTLRASRSGLPLPLPLLLLLAGLLLLALVSFSRRVDDPDGFRLSGEGSDAGAAVRGMHGTAGPLRLMLASHGRVMWYYPDTDSVVVLHEGGGVHYGTFPGKVSRQGKMSSVWVVLRPHNWHPTSSQEVLMELEAETGKQLARVQIPSRFTHDAVRSGNTVYLCNTERGAVLELSYPSMKPVRSMPLFTRQQHVNTLAPLQPGHIWAVLHNLGRSEIVQIRIPTATSSASSSRHLTGGGAAVVQRLTGVGTKSHGLVDWKGGFVSLDSDKAQLVWVERPGGRGGASSTVAKVNVLWKAPDEGKFLKGLAVVDGIAYFGVSMFAPRSARQDPAVDSELAAFDLKSNKLLWRRTVPTRGLLNVVSAPHLGEDSTYRPMVSHAPGRTASSSSNSVIVGSEGGTGTDAGAGQGGSTTHLEQGQGRGEDLEQVTANVLHRRSVVQGKARRGAEVWHATPPPPADVTSKLHAARETLLSNTAVQEATRKLTALGFPPKLGGHWGTGLPYLDLGVKATRSPWEAGLQLPLTMVNISALQALVAGTPAEMWELAEQRKSNVVIEGRRGNTDQFKPGVKAIIMQFSDQSIEKTYRFPYYNYYKEALEPLLEQVIGADAVNNIVRLQLAMMPVGSTIRLHRDMGGYALKAHRIHLPVFTNQDVSFQVCPRLDERTHGRASDEMITEADDCVSIPMAEGMVFELNNRVIHRVLNTHPTKARVQLVVDVAESPRSPLELPPGASCQYLHATIVCRGLKDG